MHRTLTILIAVVLLAGFGCAQKTETVIIGPPAEVRQIRPMPTTAETPEAPPVVVAAPETVPVPETAFATYAGPWFEIRYPDTFTARQGQAGCLSTGRCDSAYFSSPDKAVEFYVFSPQWGGDPAIDLAVRTTERLVSEKTEIDTSDAVFGPRTIRWMTIAAKDGSYTRSFVEITDENGGSWLRHAFGIRYKNQAAYTDWREAYLAFKASLVQYSD